MRLLLQDLDLLFGISPHQIINLKNDGVYWFDSNSLIVSVPVGQDAMDVMVRFCLTEKGAPTLGDIEERLDRLN